MIAEINSQKIYYTDTGGPGIPVLFSHGFLMDSSMFDSQVEYLRDEFRCITYDTRGHGSTRESDQPFDLWDLADDALSLLAHLGIEKAILVGMSQGGLLSIRAALRAPQTVLAMCLIGARGVAEAPESVAPSLAVFEEWAANGPDKFAKMFAGGLGIGDAPYFELWLAKWRRWENEHPGRVRNPAKSVLMREDITPRLQEITCPTLVMQGADDELVSVEVGSAFAQSLPNGSELTRIEHAGHAPNLTHPDRVNPILLDFLREVS
uniref:alpha/beta fold hydrolase n=1 Tax=Rhodococcus qingshengii TaxID=334542 RepID=UPI001C4E12C3|nr:alpha/beta hydrolase [Rhodococcus qingshengii]